mgnify:CR=1 FL=1
MLSGISVVCFASSYGVAMLLEITRFFVRTGIRNVVMIGFAAAGLFAHSVFLSFLLRDRWQEGLPLATWYAGRWIGIMVSLASAVSWLVADLNMLPAFSSAFIL